MGFEGRLDAKMNTDKTPKSRRRSSRHMRSKSEPNSLIDILESSPDTPHQVKMGMSEQKGYKDQTKKGFSRIEECSMKKQEILHLKKCLQDQFLVRSTLEEAQRQRPSIYDASGEKPMSQPAKDLIKEIAVLEWEVGHLEKYLLTLYRKAFNQQIAGVSCPTKGEKFESPPDARKGACQSFGRLEKTSKGENLVVHSNEKRIPQDPRKEVNASMANDMLLDSGIYRSQSTLSIRSAFGIRNSPTEENVNRGPWSYHSQPLSSLEYAANATSGATTLAEQLGTGVADHVAEAPNRISEEMIKCMAAIYCKVSDPPLTYQGLSCSPISSLSTENVFSPPDQYDTWSPCRTKESSFDARLDNPFSMEGVNEFSGPYNTMAEVPWICRDNQRLKDIDDMLQKYKSFVRRLEKIDVRNLKHKEKLAFWINIHNALVMHALLVYGIPENNVKRISLILKAAYNVGGQTISADTIQCSILRCRIPRPVQWLRIFFSPKAKFKSGDIQQAYAIEQPEPLLHFALCSGSHSDPAIRMYTPKKVFQELEIAREEYIRASLGVRKEQKIVLPKIVESFVKDSSLCSASVVEMIHQSIPESLRKTLRSVQGRPRKSIEWIPHNFAFRYLISNELVR